jgi:hypothetical protein
MQGRRRFPRRPELLMAYARCSLEGGGSSVIIRDISRGGARLMVPGGLAMSDPFELDIPALGLIAIASCRWRLGDEVGVAFLSSRKRSATRSGNTLARLLALEDELVEAQRRH